MEKVGDRLRTCDIKYMSMAGRITVKSILSAMPMYGMSVLQLPI